MSKYRVLLRKGKVMPAELNLSPVRDAGGFDFPTKLVGKSKWVGTDGGGVSVYYDPSLGASGLAVATDILGRVDDLMAYLDSVFGVKGKSGNVIVCALDGATDGSTGAYHYGCGFDADGAGYSDWYEDVSPTPLLTFGLAMAEICESYMGLQGKGWNCGGSGGEGLSRFLAEIVSGGPSGALGAFASGPSWDGSDWISKDQGTDQDYPSIGCSILYLWWMTKLGYTVPQIVQAGEPDGTLATNFAALTGNPASGAFAHFQAAVAAAGGPTSDNPFGAMTPPYPLSTPVPPPPPPPVPPPPVPPPPPPPVPPPTPSATVASVQTLDASGTVIATFLPGVVTPNPGGGVCAAIVADLAASTQIIETELNDGIEAAATPSSVFQQIINLLIGWFTSGTLCGGTAPTTPAGAVAVVQNPDFRQDALIHRAVRQTVPSNLKKQQAVYQSFRDQGKTITPDKMTALFKAAGH